MFAGKRENLLFYKSIRRQINPKLKKLPRPGKPERGRF
jgi:hypothetical protein